MSKVLVIVVSYNGMRWLERCLGSVSGADLYVWDNDSTDGSADFVAARFPEAHLVRCAENIGFAAPNNKGMQYALEHGYDYVYLLNQDAWLESGTLETLVTAASARPEFAVLSPLQLASDGTLDKQFAKLLGPRGEDYKSNPIPVRRVMAAHWLLPVKAIREIGLFNEKLFPLYGQDDDWCNRARHRGYKIGIVPEARAVHDRAGREESKDRLIERNYRSASLVRLADPNRPLSLSFLYVCLYTLVKAIKYGSIKVFKAFRQVCSQLPAVRSARR